MTDFLTKPQYVPFLSAEERVKNSYSAHFYGVQSGDPQTDEMLKDSLRRSFGESDVALDDRPQRSVLEAVHLNAYLDTMARLDGREPSTEQIETLTTGFAAFTNQYDRYFDVVHQQFDRRHDDLPLDHLTMTQRQAQSEPELYPEPADAPFEDAPQEDHSTMYPYIAPDLASDAEPTQDELDAMQGQFAAWDRPTQEALDGMQDSFKDWTPHAPHPEPGIRMGHAVKQKADMSYAAHVPQVKDVTRTYQERRQDERDVKAMKDVRDPAYDTYARNREPEKKYTAGDQFGFDEHEKENDGPSL